MESLVIYGLVISLAILFANPFYLIRCVSHITKLTAEACSYLLPCPGSYIHEEQPWFMLRALSHWQWLCMQLHCHSMDQQNDKVGSPKIAKMAFFKRTLFRPLFCKIKSPQTRGSKVLQRGDPLKHFLGLLYRNP